MIHVLVVLAFYSNVCGARRILYLPTEALSAGGGGGGGGTQEKFGKGCQTIKTGWLISLPCK